MGLIEAPCLNCKKRKDSCHSTCKLYLDYRAKLDAINEERFNENEYAYFTNYKNKYGRTRKRGMK